jgi:DNA repair protein RadC
VKNWKAYELVVKRKKVADQSDERVEQPAVAAKMFRDFAKDSNQESLFVMVLGGRNNLIGIEQVYVGTATGTSVRVNEVFRSCILTGGQGIVVVHNHPSGDHSPSDEDKKLTEDLIRGARLLDIEFLDHLVISSEGYTSIRSNVPNIWAIDLERSEVIV